MEESKANESSHEIWALIDVWNQNPFGGPLDTSYPYANQILDTTNRFIIPNSCPDINPIYPTPRQNLPQIFPISTGLPGSPISFAYTSLSNTTVNFVPDKPYYAVFFHGIERISAPLDVPTLSSTIPVEFEARGIVIVVIAGEVDAPTEESVIAGPVFLLLQPTDLVGSQL